MLRPGPYVCGEWDFGGLPYYLLNCSNRDCDIRTTKNEFYKTNAKRWLDAIDAHIINQMVYNGGNILMVQLENEYGSYPYIDEDYIDWIKQVHIDNGITGPFYTSDGVWQVSESVTSDGAAVGLDGEISDKDFKKVEKIRSNVPILVGEIYPGWLRHWGEKPWSITDIK